MERIRGEFGGAPWVWCGLPACSVARRRGGGKRRRRKARVLGEEDEEMGVGRVASSSSTFISWK